jgi:hypothetical protein
VAWGVGGKTAKGLMSLAVRGHRPVATSLIRRHDDVDETLEEVTLGVVAGAPGSLERLVGFEVLAGAA